MALTEEQKDRLRKRYADKTRQEQSREFLNLRDGEAVIVRILPPLGMDPETGVEYYWEIGKHYNFGPEGQKTMLWCPKVCRGLECPICDKAEELQRGTAEEKALASACLPSIYYLVDVLILAGPFPIGQETPKLEPTEVKLYNGHSSELDVWTQTCLDSDYQEPIWNLQHGVPFVLDCREGRRPMFQARARRNAFPVDPAVLEMRHDFEEVVVTKPPEFIREILEATQLKPKTFPLRR